MTDGRTPAPLLFLPERGAYRLALESGGWIVIDQDHGTLSYTPSEGSGFEALPLLAQHEARVGGQAYLVFRDETRPTGSGWLHTSPITAITPAVVS